MYREIAELARIRTGHAALTRGLQLVRYRAGQAGPVRRFAVRSRLPAARCCCCSTRPPLRSIRMSGGDAVRAFHTRSPASCAAAAQAPGSVRVQLSTARLCGVRCSMRKCARQRGCSAAQPWWQGAAIYQIYPRSFADFERRRHRRPAGHHAEARLRRAPRRRRRSGCRPSSPRRCGISATTSPTIATSIRCSARSPTSTRWSSARTRSASRSSSTRSIRTRSDQHPWFRKAGRAATNAKADWYVWADRQARRLAAQQLAVGVRRAGVDLGRPARAILSAQFPARAAGPQPAQRAPCRTRCSTWRASGSTAASTASASTRSTSRCTTPNCATIRPRCGDGKRTRPFDFQQHVHNQSHPDIVKFVERLRAVTDSYDGRFTLAEVGGDHALAEMRAFTHGDCRLNSAYGFDFLYAEKLTPELVARVAQDWPEDSGLADLGVREPRRAARDLTVVRRRASRRLRTRQDAAAVRASRIDHHLSGRGARASASRCPV